MARRGGGVILHNASICAAQPLWYEPIYNVTKAALMMFSKSLATELIGREHPRQLRQPGPHPDRATGSRRPNSSPPTRAATGGAISTAVANEHAAIKRFASAEELANFFVFLCSERASYSVGSTYFVDGGMLKTV